MPVEIAQEAAAAASEAPTTDRWSSIPESMPLARRRRGPSDAVAVTGLSLGILVFVVGLVWVVVPTAEHRSAVDRPVVVESATVAVIEVPDLPAPPPPTLPDPEPPRAHVPAPAPTRVTAPAVRPARPEPEAPPVARSPAPSDRIDLLTPHSAAKQGEVLRFSARLAGEDAQITLFVRPLGGAWQAHPMRADAHDTFRAVVPVPRETTRLAYRLEGRSGGRDLRLGSHSHHYSVQVTP